MFESKNMVIKVISLLILVLSINLAAQEKSDDSWKSKIKNIKGDVKEIIISTNSGSTTFEGDEAADLLEYLKEGRKKMFKIKVDGDFDFDYNDASTFIFESDSDEDVEHSLEKNIVWVSDFIDDSLGEGIEKEINVKIEDGKKIITVTTSKDGKETVKTYTGKEADKFLESNGGKHVKVKILEDGKLGSAMFFGKGSHKLKNYGKKFRVYSGHDSDETERNINVEKKDGKLKVTVTTTVDGKKEIKVYEGDDAEKYLEENNSGDDEDVILMEVCTDGKKSECSKKVKVKIITEDKKDED